MEDFFLVRTGSLFTLRTFGAQINWRVISRKVLFAPHRFLSNKSPIHFAWASGNGNTFFRWQMAHSKWKWTSIATVPDLCPTTVKILTHLFSRYQLPLKVFKYCLCQASTKNMVIVRPTVHSHAPSIRSHRRTKVVWPDFQPMRVPEEPVCVHLFRQKPVFTSLLLKSPVRVVPQAT